MSLLKEQVGQLVVIVQVGHEGSQKGLGASQLGEVLEPLPHHSHYHFH